MKIITFSFGTYMSGVMSFKLMNVPLTFQCKIDSLLDRLPFVKVDLDDVVIFSGSHDDHVAHMKHIAHLVEKHSLVLKIKK